MIEGITPRVDGGRFPIKRITGDEAVVEADVFADGHDELGVRLLWCAEGAPAWHSAEMAPLGNDRWRGAFTCGDPGSYRYAVEGWVDAFGTWVRDMRRRVEAGQNVSVELLIGAQLIDEAAARADGRARERLARRAHELGDDSLDLASRSQLALGEDVLALVKANPDLSLATRSDELPLTVDRERARFSTWYELFPRSTAVENGRHGTFRDVIARLPHVAGLGFDVLYLPPIHPIGTAFRKGPNNALEARASDPGVPWAIGSAEGGHTALHPELGSIEDFRALRDAAGGHGMELALDIAFQASPDHPWAREHPEWFRRRPDGSIQYAENPPKKYQDIYPLDFATEAWSTLWDALAGVMDHWAREGVRIFRVDNPHTKPFGFWEWAIARLKRSYPDLILLSEAFTRPRLMYRLAKAGFSQSYTYFTWRTTKQELTDYLIELTQTEVSEYFRPNLWPNTPDILHESLQSGGRPAFEARVVLAAMLSSSYGIYGPAYELMEAVPREPGSEEYLGSEKYQLRSWDPAAETIAPLIGRLNAIRQEHPCLQRNDGLRFHPVDDDALICFSKRTPEGRDAILVVVNLDSRGPRRGTLALPLETLGLDAGAPFEAHDLLSGETYTWRGPWNDVELVPGRAQAHVFELRQATVTAGSRTAR